MSKFLCACGFVILDNGALEHHMGRILREQSAELYHESATREIADFINAVRTGKRSEWIAEFYGQPGLDLEDDATIVFDIWTLHDPQTLLDIYQCDACGRIYIERAPHTFVYRAFKPEDEDWKGTLAEHLPAAATGAKAPAKPQPRPWWKCW